MAFPLNIAPSINYRHHDDDDNMNPNSFPKVTKILSSHPISQGKAFNILINFLAKETEKDVNTGRRRRLDKLFQVGEGLACNDKDRYQLMNLGNVHEQQQQQQPTSSFPTPTAASHPLPSAHDKDNTEIVEIIDDPMTEKNATSTTTDSKAEKKAARKLAKKEAKREKKAAKKAKKKEAKHKIGSKS